MKNFSLAILFSVLGSFSILNAQPEVISNEKLAACLPPDNLRPEHFEAGKITGKTTEYLNAVSSYAAITWHKPESVEIKTGNTVAPSFDLRISIADYGENNSVVNSAMDGWTEEAEIISTSDTYEKNVRVRNRFPGVEKWESIPDYQSASLEFYVDSRFIITLVLDGSNDVKLLYKMAEAIDIELLLKYREESLKGRQ